MRLRDIAAPTAVLPENWTTCQATGYWKTNSIKYNFLLIAHEYLFVFRKP